MTHLEQIKQMLTSIEYSFEIVQIGETSQMIEISSDGNNVHGYLGFVATLSFDKEGKLEGIGVYE